MDFNALLNTIITLSVLLMIGYVAAKLNIINEVASKNLSNLIIKIGNPALIISSIINMEHSAENLKLGGLTLLAGFIIHIIMAILSFFICLKLKNTDERKVSEFTIIFGNVGFIGLPILDSIFGDRGVFMGAFIIISFNVVLWTWGIAILARKREDIKITLKTLILNYGTVASAIGMVIYLLNFKFPTFVYSSFSYVASLCTPITLFITGALLARRSFKQIFLSPKVYFVCFVRLIFMPLVICLLCKLVGLSSEWTLFLTVIAGMPAASTISMLSDIYEISPGYAAQCVGTTSVLSMLTIPCVVWIAQQIIII